LYCISKIGEVVVVSASDKFEVLARVPLGEPSFAAPAVADGVMYLRSRSRLFSLGSSGKSVHQEKLDAQETPNPASNRRGSE
jgi:hypothetical protein